MIALEALLADARVQVLIAAARHAHSAMTFDTALRTQRRAAANLDFALQPFELDEPRETLTNLKTVPAAAVPRALICRFCGGPCAPPALKGCDACTAQALAARGGGR